jgi:hypothetical protein
MNPEPLWPPAVGGPLPRAADAYTTPEKLVWILAVHGHGQEWARVFRIGENDAQRLWQAISHAVLDASIYRVIDREPNGVVCGVEMELTIAARVATVRTSWHYEKAGEAPRLVTAYPSL